MKQPKECAPCQKKLIIALIIFTVLFWQVFRCYEKWCVAEEGNEWVVAATHAHKSRRKQMPQAVRHRTFAKLLRGVGGALDTENVPWMISFGTLLGWFRGGDFIPHDDDVDVICFVKDIDAILRALRQHTTFTVTDRSKHIGRIMATDPETMIQLDIFLFEQVSSLFWRQYTFMGRWSWPMHGKMLYDNDAFFPLKRATLQGIPVNVPNKPQDFLEARYGPTYMTPDRH